MPLRATIFITVLLAFTSGNAQSKEPRLGPPVARLSYHTTYDVHWREAHYSQVCFALYRGGNYRLSRTTKDDRETLQGTLSQDQLNRIRKLAGSLRPQTRDNVLVYQGSESFVAQVIRNGNTVSYEWIDPDHRQPFPDAANSIVDWLQDFKAEGASPLDLRELSEQPICPPASEKWVQPTVASLQK